VFSFGLEGQGPLNGVKEGQPERAWQKCDAIISPLFRTLLFCKKFK